MPVDYQSIVTPALLLAGVTAVMVSAYFVLTGPDRDSVQLQEWAQRNHCRVVESERRYFWQGPFWLSSSRVQRIYRITTIDEAGRTRQVYARFGSYWWGMPTEEIRFVWDQDTGAG